MKIGIELDCNKIILSERYSDLYHTAHIHTLTELLGKEKLSDDQNLLSQRIHKIRYAPHTQAEFHVSELRRLSKKESVFGFFTYT